MLRYFLFIVAMPAVVAPARAEQALQAVPFTNVKVADRFWAPRIKLNREKVLPHNFEYCEKTGRISNFAKAAGLMPGKFEGIFFNDSDVYKVIEGAAYSLALEKDPALEKMTDDVIDKIAAAQRPDGYLYTFYTVNNELDKRWSNEPQMHETYCAGHLIEAAVAYYQATGKRKLLDVARRLADHIDSVFGPDKKHEVPGHEEIELALVKLYRVTNEPRYLKLAQFFIEERGHANGRRLQGEYSQDHKPVRDQSEIVGHAVRAMYLYSGTADVAGLTGDQGYVDAMERVWQDVVGRKMYITGGIGPSASNEGFTVPYDLPNDTAYAETCASIGMALWNHRLNLLHGDARYADVLERVLYNGLISGVSLDGGKFFYVNPLASRGSHHRQPWFGCACCPTNIVRFLPSIGGYAYAYDDGGVTVNLYLASQAKIPLKGNPVTVTQETRYPWDGRVKLTVSPKAAGEFALRLRVPGWCTGAPVPSDLYRYADEAPAGSEPTLKVNGKAGKLEMEKGYACIRRAWKAGDVVELNLPMPIRRIKANPAVKADAGRIALQRGPIVYCVEGADTNGRTCCMAVPPSAKLISEHHADLLGGVTLLKGTAMVRLAGDDAAQPVDFTAIPYYAWDNREPGPMAVWLPEDPKLADPLPKPTIAGKSKASASHTWERDTVTALNDQLEPARSSDESIPRFTWWDHKGTTEWVQYDFAGAQTVSSVSVYWFDDTGKGSCRVPASWKLLYKDGDAWKPVAGAGAYGTKLDAANRVTFDPVKTGALRIEAQLQPGFSGGILEWKVE